jgi:hypothetical protein
MYRIDLDMERKRIDISFYGHIDLIESQNFTKDMRKILCQFENDHLLALVDIVRLEPFPQECLELYISGLTEASYYIRKIAIVYKKVITRMQHDRILRIANSQSKYKFSFQSFQSRLDALNYLYEQ